MRLSEPYFDAEFIGRIDENGSFWRQGASIEGAQGILLVSPCGYPVREGTHSVIVPFANPRNAPAVPANFLPVPRWQMSGTGLDDLTISPSVDCTVERPEHVTSHRAMGIGAGECSPGRRCWHGWITNGEVTI